MLKVMAGERVDIKCDTWYKYTAGQSIANTSALSDILLQMALAMGGASGGKISGAQTGTNGSVFTAPVNSLLGNQTADATDKPRAFINWVMLDEQLNTAAGSGSATAQPGAKELKAGQKGVASVVKDASKTAGEIAAKGTANKTVTNIKDKSNLNQ